MTASGYEAGWGEVGREIKHSTSKARMLSSAHILHSIPFQTRTWQHGQVNELNVCPSILAPDDSPRVNPYRGQTYLIQTGIQFIFSELFLSLLLGRIALPVQANEAPPGNRTK